MKQGKLTMTIYSQLMKLNKLELEMAKERGDAVVKLQHKRQQLEKERDRIMNDLDGLKNKGRSDRPRTGLSNAGADIIGSRGDFDRADLDPAMKDKLIADQVKINYLREQQQKTNQQMIDMDELDFLENEVNNRANRNHPRTANMHDKPSAPASFESFKNKFPDGFKTSLPPRANNSDNIADDLKDLRKDYVNNGGNDLNFLDKVDDLNDFFKNRAPPMVKDKFAIENSNAKVADHPYPLSVPPIAPPSYVPPGFPPYGGAPFPPAPYPQMQYPYQGVPPFMGYPPDPYLNNPNLQYMDSLVKQTEEENRKLQDELERIRNDDLDFEGIANRANDDVEMLKKQLMPNGVSSDEPFPEEFIFRQNDFRSEDLEVEERALMNIAAQEYDHLRLLSRLPTNSELYRYKMDQYKELSTMRAEIEKVLQEQRLEKIRRDYEKQKYEDDRRYNHERWLEEQKREILAAKLRNQAEGGNQYQPPPPQDYQDMPNYDNPDDYPMQTQNYNQKPPATQFPPKTAHVGTKQTQGDEKVYDPKTGFLAFFDTVARIPREHKGMQVVYGAYNNGRPLNDNRMIALQD